MQNCNYIPICSHCALFFKIQFGRQTFYYNGAHNPCKCNLCRLTETSLIYNKQKLLRSFHENQTNKTQTN